MPSTSTDPRELTPPAPSSGGLRGVLFDYGGTLVTFSYPTEDLLEVLREFRPRVEAATGAPAPEADAILRDVLHPLEEYITTMSEDEVEYMDVYRETWRRAGLELPDGLLHDILDAEQRCWDRAVRVDPDVLPVLSWLGAHGIKRGICSNAPFPPAMMRRQLDVNGIAPYIDGVVFSSEVGRRKPAPDVYLAALAAIGTRPEATLFVGDRVREDFEGPTAAGMRAVLVTRDAADRRFAGIPTIASLAELPGIL
ncbi:MAG TPA: HAD family hydrolase [Candidatus Baltobacterales bacterium]|nr:HAD family hydrolase [Candidatus Baltobacterales bacterium]